MKAVERAGAGPDGGKKGGREGRGVGMAPGAPAAHENQNTELSALSNIHEMSIRAPLNGASRQQNT